MLVGWICYRLGGFTTTLEKRAGRMSRVVSISSSALLVALLASCANVDPTITMASQAGDGDGGDNPVSTTPTVGRVVPLAGVGEAGGYKLRSRVSFKTEEHALKDSTQKYVLKGSATMRGF